MKTFTRRNFGVFILCFLQFPALATVLPGTVIGWGSSIAGETTGTATGNTRSAGVVVIAKQPLGDAVAISAGNRHSLALRGNGTVIGWGDNYFGEAIGFKTDIPTNGQVKLTGDTLNNVRAISAGHGISLVLRDDGKVISWGEKQGENNWGELKVPSAASNVVAIAAGTRRCLALQKDGQVVEWNTTGEMEPTPAGLTNIIAIAAGGFYYGHNLALTADGNVIDWTAGGVTHPVPKEATNVISIASGDTHNLALRRDGTVVGWGSNQFGEVTGVPTQGYVDISMGVVSIAGQRLTNIVAIVAGHEFSLALRNDGTVVGWGSKESPAASVPAGLNNIAAIAAGYDFCLAITTNSAVAERFRH